ncbi:MAG: DUF58 domain-containing protein [Chlamydiota bacterium]
MLYPDFNDLIALGDQKLNITHPSCRSVKSTVLGNHRSSFRGVGLEFDSVREYVLGDDIRNIDWRVTARTGTAHLKILKEERERHVVLCIDMNATMRFGTKGTFKSVQAARVAAILGWGAIARQDRVSVCFFGDVPGGIQFFAPKRTRKSFCSVLKKLTLPPIETHKISVEAPLRYINQLVHTGSLVYVISDFMDIDKGFRQEACLSRISKKCDIVFVGINDVTDKLIHPMGVVGFQANSLGKVSVNTENLVGQKAYAHLWQEHQEKLQDITSRFKIPLLELMTDSKVHKDLILGLKKIASRKKI